MFKTSESRKNLFSALLRAKKNFDPVIKDSTNPYFKSKYESLNGVLDAVENALNDEGVILLQPSSTDGTSNFITTRLEHVETGEFTDSTLKLEKTSNMQEVGAATTYGRRQTLKGLLGLKAEDDDGNAASGKRVETPKTVQVESKSQGGDDSAPLIKKGPGRPTKAINNEKTVQHKELESSPISQAAMQSITKLPTKAANGFAGNGTHNQTVNEDEW
jgi:hypothetical protein